MTQFMTCLQEAAEAGQRRALPPSTSRQSCTARNCRPDWFQQEKTSSLVCRRRWKQSAKWAPPPSAGWPSCRSFVCAAESIRSPPLFPCAGGGGGGAQVGRCINERKMAGFIGMLMQNRTVKCSPFLCAGSGGGGAEGGRRHQAQAGRAAHHRRRHHA